MGLKETDLGREMTGEKKNSMRKKQRKIKEEKGVEEMPGYLTAGAEGCLVYLGITP